MKSVSLFIIPPILSLSVGLSLGVLSLFKGTLKRENVLLSLVCVWWTMLSWAFICHHLINDEQTLLAIERVVHFFYVYIPVVTLLFFHVIIKRRWNALVILCLGISIIISLFTQTEYYFYGFYRYSWGLIAKTGVAFQIFSLYSAAVTLYVLIIAIKSIREEKNPVTRVKYTYFFAAILLSAFLTLTNVPAMNGVDFYPLGNFLFIPLAILTYGILRYRLMDIRSVLHVTVFWFIISSIIVVPNIIACYLFRPYLSKMPFHFLFMVFLIWFVLNYLYLKKIQPVIDRIFNKENYNLEKIEAHFIEDVSLLKNLDELLKGFSVVVKQALPVAVAVLYVKRDSTKNFTDIDGNSLVLDYDIEALLMDRNSYLEKSLIETNLNYGGSREKILDFFDMLRGEYVIPLIHNEELLGVLLLSEKVNLKRLTTREISFLHTIIAYTAIALANSLIYQDLSDFKDNLESIVAERTAVIKKQKQELEKDINLAQKIQTALLPHNIPDIGEVDIAYKYVPIMGVGGDFIDLHYRKGMNELGLFICDVSGHGTASALIASMVKMSLNHWGKYITRPAEALKEMKQLLKGKMGTNFITACICCIDIPSGTLVSANAGHPPIIIVRNNGDIDIVLSKGKVFIDIAPSDYEEARHTLYRGDKLVLYTDGIIEARNHEDELLGDDEFINILKLYSKYSAKDMCQKVYDAILQYTGAHGTLDDDFALVIAEYKG